MEIEAGQKGDAWTDDDANRYGGELNQIDQDIEVEQGKLKKYEAKSDIAQTAFDEKESEEWRAQEEEEKMAKAFKEAKPEVDADENLNVDSKVNGVWYYEDLESGAYEEYDTEADAYLGAKKYLDTKDFQHSMYEMKTKFKKRANLLKG